MNRVLLVEDDPDDLELARLAFARGDFSSSIDVARDGAEALDYLLSPDREPPQVVLLDIKLPLVDGIDVLRRVKADERTRHIPVVMLTSSALDRDLHACYELGANSYIVKPVDMEQFMAAVNNIGVYWLSLNLTETHS
ncbi:response regulator [Dactylosporangium fulvum]|uniref:Response regulator n=1 Tax=Dactylosporangium fulvum TaxID=53359 RepID=A0ABY5W3S9_9ACTN|nr:response regulator [Dactylosporangium fulvum]UWP83699.1 response regulator [Dactylosporangium fulvum]